MTDWYDGKLFWVGPDLFVVTKMSRLFGAPKPIPVDVELVTW